MKKNFSFDTYLSPFTSRYGSAEMREIWSEKNKRLLWRRMWVALARAEHTAGLVSTKELEDMLQHAADIDIEKAKTIEKDVYHELMSEIQCFAGQCAVGGGKIHLGATSADILDNAQIVQVKSALALTTKNLEDLVRLFAKKIEEYEDVVCMGYTHLQPAEPTTMGYRFAFYAQDLLMNLEMLEKIQPLIQGKGLKGAVGTSASYTYLLQGTKVTPEMLEDMVMKEMGISAVGIATQTYPRQIDLLVVEALSNIAASLYKFCFDFRVLQSSMYNEWVEKRDPKRVGSSAMPFKRNPDKAEKVCSLCRYVSSLVPLAWANPANSLLERTLDDSASQRIFLPESFLAIDECMKTVKNLLTNLELNLPGIQKNLQKFGPFAATEPLLMELVKRGADRQQMHELLKSCSMTAWQGSEGDLFDILEKQSEILRYMTKKEIRSFADPSSHVGEAKTFTTAFLKKVKKILG